MARAVDASKSYLAVNYHSFDLTVRIQETGGIIAQQSYGSGDISVPGRKVTSYEVSLYFTARKCSAAGQAAASSFVPDIPYSRLCALHQFPITFAGNYTNSNNPTCASPFFSACYCRLRIILIDHPLRAQTKSSVRLAPTSTRPSTVRRSISRSKSIAQSSVSSSRRAGSRDWTRSIAPSSGSRRLPEALCSCGHVTAASSSPCLLLYLLS